MSTSTREALWEAIRRDFRRACRLRLEGRLDEATLILNNSLHENVQQWQQICKRTGRPRREPLEEMFQEEIKRVEDAWALWEIMQENQATGDQEDLKAEIRSLREQLQELALDMQIAGHQVRKAVKATMPPFAPEDKAARKALPELTEPAPVRPASNPAPARRKVEPARTVLTKDNPGRIPFGDIPSIIDEVLKDSKSSR